MFQDKAVLKILLLSRKGKPGVNASLTDAVQLHFTAPHWDLKVRTNIAVETVCWCAIEYTCLVVVIQMFILTQTYRQPYDLPEGIKLKVYGIAFAVYIKTKDKAQPAIKVYIHTIVFKYITRFLLFDK